MIANYITIRNRIRNKLDARNAREDIFELDFRQYSNKYQINRPYTCKEQRNQKICNIVIRNKLNARTPASLCTLKIAQYGNKYQIKRPYTCELMHYFKWRKYSNKYQIKCPYACLGAK